MRLDDAYRLLEIHPRATDDDVRRAYRDLMKVWHPDRFGSDEALRRKAEEKLKAINEAWETIRGSRGARSDSGPRQEEQQQEPLWKVRSRGTEEHFPDLAAIADLVSRGAIRADAELFDPVFGRWMPLTESPVLAEALRRRRIRSNRSRAITCSVLATVILLRRPTPAGLVIALILFGLAIYFLRRMK